MRHEAGIRRPNVKMAWTKFVIGVAALLLLAGMGSGCDESWHYDCGGDPYAPVDVYSITGDEEVTLYWTGVDIDRTDYFIVYRSKTANGRYYEIGHASHEYFADRDVRNGETYYYAVAAVNACDYESDLSYDLVHDTPRPEGFNARLFDANSEDWRRSGWDFNTYRAVSWDDRDVDVYFVNDNGAAYLVAADIDTDIQDAGYRKFDEIDWAPERGWSPTGAVEVIVGHSYIVWTRDNHFAKLRITDMSSNRIEFDWAYQVDNGNPELKPRTRDEGNAFNSTSFGLKKTS